MSAPGTTAEERPKLPKGSGLYWKANSTKLYCTIRINGDKHLFCTGETTVKAALEFKKEKEADLRLNAVSGVTRGVRMSELFADYVADLKRKEQDAGRYMMESRVTPSYNTARSIKKHLEPFFGHLKPEQVTTDKLNQFRDEKQAAGYSVVSINNYFTALRRAMRLGTKSTPRKVNPASLPPFPINVKAERLAAHKGTITDDQYKMILAELADHLKPIFATVTNTGIRSKEIKFVRPSQFDWEKNTIALRAGETKEGPARTVPMNNDVRSILWNWKVTTEQKWPDSEKFFHCEGQQIESWKTGWQGALKRCNLRVKNANGKWVNLVRFHDTRRTAITNMDRMSLSEGDMQVVSGHKTTKMIRAYNQSTDAVERVRVAQNAAIGQSRSAAAPVVARVAVVDWKTELKELKGMMDDGILTADEFGAEKARVLASRPGIG
jgi:integrase